MAHFRQETGTSVQKYTIHYRMVDSTMRTQRRSLFVHSSRQNPNCPDFSLPVNRNNAIHASGQSPCLSQKAGYHRKNPLDGKNRFSHTPARDIFC